MFIRSILSAAVAIAACSSTAHASVASQGLTASDFTSSIADRATFVKFYSPECKHSQKLAPTWEQLAVEHKDWKRTKGFKFAEVDCLAQGELCEDNDIVSYPTIQLYYKGKPVTKYTKERTQEALKEFVDAMASEYINVPANISVQEVGEVKVNALGKVIDLDLESYDRRTQFGPWLIEYYAPWCGHCKALAPVYEQLAGDLQGKVNVAKVDCTKNEDICRRERVAGYPTIKLHQFGQAIEFRKQRALESMSDFALGATVPSVKSITGDDLESIKSKNDVTFVYVYDAKTKPEITSVIEKQSQIFYEKIALHGSDDAELAHQLSISNGPALVALKDNRQYQYSGSLLDEKALQAWIAENKEPLVTTLTYENTGTVLSKRGWTVLGLFDPSKSATANARRELIETAYKYQEAVVAEKRTTPEGEEREALRFAILDAPKWESYVRGAFNLELSSLPAVVVINSREEMFYPFGLDGRSVPLDQASLLTYIEQIESGLLTPKSMLSATQKVFRHLQGRLRVVTKFSTEHPMLATFIGSAFVLAIMRKIAGNAPKDGAEKKEGETEERVKDIKQD